MPMIIGEKRPRKYTPGENPKVAGSNPGPANNSLKQLTQIALTTISRTVQA